MKLAGEHLFAVARERLWAALVDPELLARVLPGCEPLAADGENRWKAAMTVAVGPVKGRFTGTLELADLAPPTGYSLRLDGSGPSGFLRGSGRVELADAEGGTRLSYDLDAQVGGRIAAVGQRLVESSARALARQGLEGLERELAGQETAPSAVGAPSGGIDAAPAPPAPAGGAFALRFARGLWNELPASWRFAVAAVAAAALTSLALLLRGC